MKYTDMSLEVIEAIEEKFKNDEEILVDCFMYLLNTVNDNKLSFKISTALEKMDRCPYCGTKFEVMQYREYHPEVDAYEDMADMYCPNCDIAIK